MIFLFFLRPIIKDRKSRGTDNRGLVYFYTHKQREINNEQRKISPPYNAGLLKSEREEIRTRNQWTISHANKKDYSYKWKKEGPLSLEADVER